MKNKFVSLAPCLLFLPFLSIFSLSSCDFGIDELDKDWDQSNALLERAIDTLYLINTQWQDVLKDLELDLTKFLGDTLAPKVHDIGNHLVSQVSSSLACASSYTVNLAAARELEVLQNVLIGTYRQRDMPIDPTLCTVSLTVIEKPTVPMSLIYSGFDMMHADVHLYLIKADNEAFLADQLFDSRDNFKLSIRIDNNMFSTLKQYEWIQLRYGDQIMSQIKVKH